MAITISYPEIIVTGAATTLNYLWPMSFLLMSLIPLKHIYQHRDNSIIFITVCIIASLYAISHELVALIYACCGLAFTIYAIKNHISYAYSTTLLCLGALGLIIAGTCPGNNLRYFAEISNWYPDYAHAGFFDKLYLPIVSTASYYLNNPLILWALVTITSIIIFKSNPSKSVLISSYTILFFFVCLFIDRTYCIFTHQCNMLFCFSTTRGDVFNASFSSIILLIISLFAFINILLLIFFAAKEKAPLPILTLMIACITQVVMGFSPTVFQSGVRTISLLYYALLIIIIWIVIENRHIFSKKFLYCITILFGVYLISEYFPYIH
jgi:hypothetical protein